jgi:hypothetical protein
MLVARIVVGLIMVTGVLTVLVGSIVQSFRNGLEPQSWYFYPLLVLGMSAWLAFVGSFLAAGVYLHESGVLIVNPVWVSSLRWDEIERFSLDDNPSMRRPGLNFGRVRRSGRGSTMIWGIRPWDSYSTRQAQEAIAFLNQTLASHAASSASIRTEDVAPPTDKNE